MIQQKVYTILISQPMTGKNAITVDADGQLCLEVIPLQQYLSKGWYVKQIEMSSPESGGNVYAIIVIESNFKS